MSNQCLLEQLEISDEKNILIQGLPSSIEKQFLKLSYAKNVTPLLKRKKIEFALVFAVNKKQLCGLLKDIIPALQEKGKLWVAYPKLTSKIISDLNRHCSWEMLTEKHFEGVKKIDLDHVWSAIHFEKNNAPASSKIIADGQDSEIVLGLSENAATQDDAESGALKKTSEVIEELIKNSVVSSEEVDKIFMRNKKAQSFFKSLPSFNQREYLSWIEDGKRKESRKRRFTVAVEMLASGKKNPL